MLHLIYTLFPPVAVHIFKLDKIVKNFKIDKNTTNFIFHSKWKNNWRVL